MNGIFKNTFRLRSNSEYAKSSLVFKNSKKSNEYSSLMPTPTSQTYRKDNVNFLPKIVSKRKISSEYPKINKNELHKKFKYLKLIFFLNFKKIIFYIKYLI